MGEIPVTEYTPPQSQAAPPPQQFQPMPEHPRDEVPQYQAQQSPPQNTPDKGGMLTREEVETLIADRLSERDREHAEQVAKLQAQVPQLVVPAHSGGPGNDNHQRSWNLAEQEAAKRGEHLDHWEDR
jgi:hypothetical protein